MSLKDILESIGSTEPSTFSEFCSALSGDCPEKGDSAAWSELFGEIRGLEKDGLIEVERTAGRIDTLVLTEYGVDQLRQLHKARSK